MTPWAVALAVLLAWPAGAAVAPPPPSDALAQPRPEQRPGGLVEVLSSAARPLADAPLERAFRPQRRQDPEVAEARLVQAILANPLPAIEDDGTVRLSDRPVLRQAMGRPRPQGGGLCQRPGLVGEAIGEVTGRGACGIPSAVRVRAVAGVTLSQPARMDCATARALDDWVRGGVIPAIGGTGGGVMQLRVAAGYVCKTRNSRPGARLSEHSYGRAIDISAFVLANGTALTVRGDWGNGARGRILETIWRAACGPFGTVLGPRSDRFHQGHFHVDTARYRSGSYCR
ncbi:extensin family protein [Jannaschia sp. LMIT008]|uniref:extensin-like domain-containing protein n=1 Tax=Jannaschia maritima TaxID=3032585 RepID=UPI0028117079|nr:extensin family protein [Jannaschia sp. LMIT008]